jgi:hypothetical protein
MKDYKLNGNFYEITLENEKKVKVSKKWADNTIEKLETDLEDVLLMWLEDEGYLDNEEQDDLNKQAKINGVKVKADTDKPKKKTPKERVAKPQPEKEYIVGIIAEFLEDITDISNLNIENKAKLITFDYKGASYKLDLVQKRAKKEEK